MEKHTSITLSTYSFQRPSKAPQNPPPTARLLVNVYAQGTANKLVTFSQNVSPEGESKWEELSIGLTTKQAVDIEVICENTSALPVFFDNLEVKVQAVPTVLVVQENHYMPFGLGMKGLDWTLQGQKEDKYSFQSKEKQTDFDLNISDFEARGFDYQINRTWQIDPHAESYANVSPYSFFNNNPLRYIDPTGKDVTETSTGTTYTGVHAQNAFRQLQNASKPLDDIFLNKSGGELGRIKNKQPNRYFLEHTLGDFSYQNKDFIQLLSAESLKGDIKEKRRENKWSGFIVDLTEGNNDVGMRGIVDVAADDIKGSSIPLTVAAYESRQGGIIDFAKYFSDGTLYKINGIHMNSHEALNYYWGGAVQKIGISPAMSLRAANSYHLFAKLSKDRYAGAPFMNEPNHDRAIKLGYFNYSNQNIPFVQNTNFGMQLDYSKWNIKNFLRPIGQ